MPQLTVTIEGPQAAGKTRLAELLHDALLDAGATPMPCSDPHRPDWVHFGSTIRIIEKQS